MLGFGSIGQGVLPLILRHIDIPYERIVIITGDDRGRDIAAEYGINFTVQPLTRENYRDVLTPLVQAGDFLLNLSVDVSSVALIAFCQRQGALYHDTCIEPWVGGYTDPSLTPSQRSNYALRESALALAGGKGPTAVMTHGANPGLVSHFVKQALLNLARDTGVDTEVPTTRQAWAALSQQLGVKVIHMPNATPRPHPTPSNRASSSTPGRSTALWVRAASPPNSAGARTRKPYRQTGTATILAVTRRST
jgi:homospermidine synthase